MYNIISKINTNEGINQEQILGDLENSSQINIMILNTKKTFYLSKLECKIPSLEQVQSSTKQVINYEYYKRITNDKIHLFEKKWSLLLNSFQYDR